MNIWEAKYETLLMGIQDQQLIDNAEHLVEVAWRQTTNGIGTFEQNVLALQCRAVVEKLRGACPDRGLVTRW